MVTTQRDNFTDLERLNYFLELSGEKEFPRKDYMQVFMKISNATATRDLRKGIQEGLLKKTGRDRTTLYQKK